MPNRSIGTIIARTSAAVLGSAALVGCSMGDFSQPTLSLRGAEVSGDSASFDIAIDNPSDFDLTLTSIDYSVTYGPLPVASGVWSSDRELPSRSQLNLTLEAPFDSSPIDPTADRIELSGTMNFEDAAHSGAMELESAPFSDAADVR